MASVHDVAAYILRRQRGMTTMKLQKLVYYSQAWHLVWDGVPLFDSPIEAWMNGPVVPELYQKHRGRFTVSDWPGGDADALTKDEAESVDVVLAAYGKLEPKAISDLTHKEKPWQEAREGLSATDRGHVEITLDSMQQFYDAIADR